VKQLKEEKKNRPDDNALDFDLQRAITELKAKKKLLEQKVTLLCNGIV
jgi:hypothetical protein